MIWFILFLTLCGTLGCVAIIGSDNATVSQTGMEFEADIETEVEGLPLELDEEPAKSKD